jgi:hypothetical protein
MVVEGANAVGSVRHGRFLLVDLLCLYRLSMILKETCSGFQAFQNGVILSFIEQKKKEILIWFFRSGLAKK